MKIEQLTVGALGENCYLVMDETTNRGVLIDPGDEPQRIIDVVRQSGTTLDAIWLTHAHFDHVGGIAGVVREYPVPVYMHPLEEPVLAVAVDAGLRYGVRVEAPPAADVALEEGDRLAIGSLEFEVLHVPGHAPGHVAFVGHGGVFGGDCLFAGSVGTTDIEFGDREALDASLRRLTALGDELTVLPGHGPLTTIGHERDTNPFLIGAARLVRVKR